MKVNYFYLPAGTLLNGRYLIKDKLAEASNLSIPYLAYDKVKNRKVVIKEFFPKNLVLRDYDGKKVIVKNKGQQKRLKGRKKIFAQEAETISKFKHDNIVKCYSYFLANNTSYIVLKYYKGKNLRQYLADNQLDLYNFLRKIFIPLIDIINSIQKEGYIHGDIKPDNIIVNKDSLILLDFGSAIKYSQQQRAELFISSGFSPLELYAKDSQKGTFSDIYSLSALLYYYCTGFPPLEAKKRIIKDNLTEVKTINKKISSYLNNFINKNLSLNIRKRDKKIYTYKKKVLVEYYRLKVKKILQIAIV